MLFYVFDSNFFIQVIADQDLAGPLVFCLLFGAALLLHGKVHFGYIYGIGVVGCVGMYFLLNMMTSENANISMTCTVSVLGYCLLPMALLSILAAVLSLQVSCCFSIICIFCRVWSAMAYRGWPYSGVVYRHQNSS